MNPTELEEMAWTLANNVSRKGVALAEYHDDYLAKLFIKAKDRRAIFAFALMKGWVALEDYGAKAYGRDYYIVGPSFHKDKRDRYEKLHGIGSYPREDWEDAGPIRRAP